MRYQIVIAGPVVPAASNVVGAEVRTVSATLATTDDLELAWLILNWAGEERLMPHERLGVWDSTLQDWRQPDRILQEG